LSASILILGGAAFFLTKNFRDRTGVNLAGKPEVQEVTQNQKSLPENFPTDFPLYRQATFKEAWSTGKAESGGISVIWETSDAPPKVAVFYKDELVKKNWKINSSFNNSGSFVISFEKGGTSGFVGISQNGKTIISVTLGW